MDIYTVTSGQDIIGVYPMTEETATQLREFGYQVERSN